MRGWILCLATVIGAALLWLAQAELRTGTAALDAGRGGAVVALGPAGPAELAEAAVAAGSSAARTVEGEALHGRVEHALDGRPVAGFELTLFGPEGLHGRATSGPDGAFTLLPFPALPPTEGCAALRAVDADGARASGNARLEALDVPVPVTRDARGMLAPIVVRVQAVAHGSFARTLVDEATGEPVPFCELRLVRDGWGNVAATSDERGVLRSPVSLPNGAAVAIVVDHPLASGAEFLPPVRVELGAADAAAPPLAIRVGPTLRLALKCAEPFAPEDLVAALRRARDPVDDWTLTWTVPVRSAGDAGPWVRLRPLALLYPFDTHAEERYLLELRDDHRGLHGTVELPCHAGVHPGTVRVRLARVGSVRGRVLDVDGAPTADARVSLFDGARPGIVLEQETTTNGAFVFHGLPAGQHTLRVFTREHGAVVRAVPLAPGETREVDVTLVRRPVGRIAGTARMALGGAVPHYALLRLTPLASADAVESAGLVFHTDLRRDEARDVTRFDFGALPVGRYELAVVAYGGPSWEPTRLVLEGPRDDVELVCRNDLGELPLVATGPPAERYLRAEVDGVWVSERLVHGRAVLPTTRVEDVREWALLEAGKRAARGNGWQLERATEGPDLGALLVAAPLAPGYARVVFVHEGGAPLQGVSVRLDDLRVAVTGSDGGVLVEADAEPVVGLDLTGYRIGAPSDDGFELRFDVERE